LKFILTLYVCSYLDLTCSPPVEYPKIFNSWEACVIEALDESKQLIKEVPLDVVNKNRLATKYTCQPISDA
tara:strand:+ start:110 stop:322 length:213 start_codon:yes stop_codon:yes gene_type:complete